MGPISPPKELPVAIKIAGGLNPERTIFIDGGVPKQAKWFDISLQCGPSLSERDDIAFRLLVTFCNNDKYSSYMTNSSIDGQWDDERGRRHELRLKGLSNDPEVVEYNTCASTSTTFLKSLRCSTEKNSNYYAKEFFKVSESDFFHRKDPRYQEMIIKSFENLQPDAESCLVTSNQNKSQIESSDKVPKANHSKSKSSLHTNTSTSKEISKDNLKPVSESLDISSSEKVITHNKSRNARTSKEVPHTYSQQSSKSSPKPLRPINAEDRGQLSSTPSHSKKNISIIEPSSEIVNIYAPTTLKIVDSIYLQPDNESVRFSNTYTELVPITKTKSQTLKNERQEHYSKEELNEIDMNRGQPFSIALECLENGYLAFLNGDLFCVYPHHFDYHRVKYVVFNGEVDLELVEVGGGMGPDRTLVVDLYDEVVWTENVVVLTDENFAELVLASEDMWMVDAYTAWCPACNKLQPEWDSTAKYLQGKVKLGASDCDRNEQLTEDLNVECFPTIYCFSKGKKSINTYKIYLGRYSVNSIVSWALQHLEYGNTNVLIDSPGEQKAVAKTLRKRKKTVMKRKGYLAGGYGYVLRINAEYANQHETSSTKFIYKSEVCQTEIELKEDDNSAVSCVCDVL